MQQTTAREILTSEFWEDFALGCDAYNLTATSQFLGDYTTPRILASYTSLKYGDIPFFPEINNMIVADRAGVALMEMGHAFERILLALLAEYDPLENYFTDRTMDTDTDTSLTKTGKEVTTPSGVAIVTEKGKMHRKGNGSDTVGQGTTYDSATTDPDNNDFYNISKTINDVDITEESDATDPRSRETSYNNYKVERSFDNRKDEGEGSESIEEHRRGNSGIFSKQDLTQREIDLRLRNRIIPILCRMVVSVFETGVYYSDD